jgi:glutathione S-transferase
MLTLYHAPQSRSGRIMILLDEMGIRDKVDVKLTTIVRRDGSSQIDPANPHPEGKVPALVHNGTVITESAAIILYLTALFPESGMAPLPGTPKRGEYLTWLFWYGSVMEPVLMMQAAGLAHPMIERNFRGVAEVTARLTKALSHQPYLLGDSYGAADLLLHSPYAWMPDATPDVPVIRDWIARCKNRPTVSRVTAQDAELMAAV